MNIENELTQIEQATELISQAVKSIRAKQQNLDFRLEDGFK